MLARLLKLNFPRLQSIGSGLIETIIAISVLGLIVLGLMELQAILLHRNTLAKIQLDQNRKNYGWTKEEITQACQASENPGYSECTKENEPALWVVAHAY